MFERFTRFVRRSAIFVLLVLTLGALVAFGAVSHLVKRFVANEQARGRRLYAQGVIDLNEGSAELAIEELRAALTCDRSNPQYQLSLGRALRDVGRLDEAQSYLQSLWERTPEDGTLNLALGRVAVKRGSVDDAVRYYHNAMYGVWSSDADGNRRKARFELVEFLLQKDALEQARSELLVLAASLPPDPVLRLRTAELLTQAEDYSDSLGEYERVLRLDRGNAAALSGAGETAYSAGRYRTAQRYLQAAVAASPKDSNLRRLSASASLVLATNPFVRRISDAERNRRVAAAFAAAGKRLNSCAKQKGIDLSTAKAATSAPSTPEATPSLATMEARWLAARGDLPRMKSAAEADLPDTIMDLTFEIEKQTSQGCGQPPGIDQALLLISANRETADQ